MSEQSVFLFLLLNIMITRILHPTPPPTKESSSGAGRHQLNIQFNSDIIYLEEVLGSTDLKSLVIQDYFILQMPVVNTAYHTYDQLL